MSAADLKCHRYVMNAPIFVASLAIGACQRPKIAKIRAPELAERLNNTLAAAGQALDYKPAEIVADLVPALQKDRPFFYHLSEGADSLMSPLRQAIAANSSRSRSIFIFTSMRLAERTGET